MPLWALILIELVKFVVGLILKKKPNVDDPATPDIDESKGFWEKLTDRAKDKREKRKEKREGIGEPPQTVG